MSAPLTTAPRPRLAEIRRSVDHGVSPPYPGCVTSRSVLIVEDEPLTASLLEASLLAQGFRVCIATSAAQALADADEFDPDAALIDISLGDGPSGLDVAHILHQEKPWIALLILTKHPDARTAGVSGSDVPAGCGFLRKDRVRDAGHVLEALEEVLAERADQVRDDRDPDRPLSGLNAHQLDILRLMALGYDNDYIARHRNASRSSVERWVMQIFRALRIETHGDLNPRVEAVRQFILASSVPIRP